MTHWPILRLSLQLDRLSQFRNCLEPAKKYGQHEYNFLVIYDILLPCMQVVNNESCINFPMEVFVGKKYQNSFLILKSSNVSDTF